MESLDLVAIYQGLDYQISKNENQESSLIIKLFRTKEVSKKAYFFLCLKTMV